MFNPTPELELMSVLQPSAHPIGPLFPGDKERRQVIWGQFRDKVLRDYDFKCHFCGFQAWKYMFVDSVAKSPKANVPETYRPVCQACRRCLHVGQASQLGEIEFWDLPGISQLDVVLHTRDAFRTGQVDMWRTSLMLAGNVIGENERHEFVANVGRMYGVRFADDLVRAGNEIPAQYVSWRAVFTERFPLPMWQLSWEGKLPEKLFPWQK